MHPVVVTIMALILVVCCDGFNEKDYQTADKALREKAKSVKNSEAFKKQQKAFEDLTKQATGLGDAIKEFEPQVKAAFKTALDAANKAALEAFKKSLENDEIMKTITKMDSKSLADVPKEKVAALKDALSVKAAVDAFTDMLPKSLHDGDIAAKPLKAAKDLQEAADKEAKEVAPKPDAGLQKLVEQYYHNIIGSCVKTELYGTMSERDFFCNDNKNGKLEACVVVKDKEGNLRDDRVQVWKYFNDKGIRRCKWTGNKMKDLPSLCNITGERQSYTKDDPMKPWKDVEKYVKNIFECQNWSATEDSKVWHGCTTRPETGNCYKGKLSNDGCSR